MFVRRLDIIWLIVLTSISSSSISCWIARHQHQSQTIRFIRSVNQLVRLRLFAVLDFELQFDLFITIFSNKWLTSYLQWLVSIIFVVSNTNSLIYLFHSNSEFCSKDEWQLINWMFFFVAKRTSANSSSQTCVSFDYWSENLASVAQCNTNSDEMNCSKHFFFYFFFDFHFICVSYSFVSVRWL